MRLDTHTHIRIRDHEDPRDHLSIRELAAGVQARINAGVVQPSNCDRLTHALVVAGYCDLEIHVSFMR
jgi:hypothetical protein